MEDSDIIDLTVETLDTIKTLLNETTYQGLGGEIQVHYSMTPDFLAWASVSSKPCEAPMHYVNLTYEMAVVLYRDVEEYYDYIESGVDNPKLDILFPEVDYPKSLSTQSSKEDCCKNMFISALTWVFYHELGHLVQEHGEVRQNYGCSTGTDVIDCSVDSTEPLEGKASAVSHVTEIAADFFATYCCLMALLQHFKGARFEEELRAFSAALALVLYRFHGTRPIEAVTEPIGTHPDPLVRLEQTQPLIVELLSKLDLKKELGSDLTRNDLVYLTGWASYSIGIFWLRKNHITDIPDYYFISGSLQRPGMLSYHRCLLDVWDEIKPEIDKIKRLEGDYSEFRFSDQYRETLLELDKTETSN